VARANCRRPGAGAECGRTGPEQARPSRPITLLAWWESGWVQLGAVVLPSLTFASYLAVAFGARLARRVRGRPYEAQEATTSRVRRWAPS
jgi:hypothetical protein